MKNLIAHLFLPHRSNNQRPKVLHPQAIIVYIVLFFFLQLGFRVGKFVYPQILGVATNITVEDLFFLTNQKRQENGLPPLSLDPALSAAAFKKAQDMFVKNYWSHMAPDGKTPWYFIEESGYHYLLAGENLAKDFADSQGVVAAWMASPSHRDNILKKEYEDIGFAVVNGVLGGEETTLVVQMFGKRKVSLAQKPPLIPAKKAMAKTNLSLSPSPTVALLPTPTPVITEVSSLRISSFLKQRAQEKPLIDILALERSLSLALVVILFGVLTVDGVLVLKRKTVRVAGHNIAHLIFLATLIGLVFLTKRGVIL